MRIFYIIVFFSLFVVLSCTSNSQSFKADVDLALRLSKGNRPELERVLDYYSKDKKDSLKLKAAKFLISNMIAHYSVGGELMDKYVKDIDSIMKDQPSPIKAIYYRIAAISVVKQRKSEIKFDLHHITADFLINNIERSFKIWDKYNHHYGMSFHEFCEYILPYRIDIEPLTDWKDSTMYKYYDLAASENIGFESSQFDIYLTYKTNLLSDIRPFLLSDTVLKRYSLDCIDKAYNELYTKRCMGLPVVVDFVPHYPNKEDRHYWLSVIDRRYPHDNNSNMRTPYAAKVFRKTYSLNPIPNDRDNFVPEFMRDPYNKDVTELYENATTVKYDFGDVPNGCKYGYLAVFNDLAWREVAWSQMKNGKVQFEKMGREIMYMPTYYQGAKQVYAKYPIRLDTDGKIIELKPNKEKTQNVKLERKFSYNILGDYSGRSLIGMQIIATNNLEDRKFDTIAIIDSYKYMSYDSVFTNTDKKYKYWMLKKTNPRTFPELGSVLLLDEKDEWLRGEGFVIDRNNILYKNIGIPENIFTDDVVTFGAVDNIIGMEFEKPQSLSKIKYVSRNDGNGVYPGEEYELFYFDEGEWVSLGGKIAVGYTVDYENVPTNALFWLRNHTKGVEERPFTIDGKRVRFW